MFKTGKLILCEGWKRTKGKQGLIASHARTFASRTNNKRQREHYKSLGLAILPATALAAATAELAR